MQGGRGVHQVAPGGSGPGLLNLGQDQGGLVQYSLHGGEAGQQEAAGGQEDLHEVWRGSVTGAA